MRLAVVAKWKFTKKRCWNAEKINDVFFERLGPEFHSELESLDGSQNVLIKASGSQTRGNRTSRVVRDARGASGPLHFTGRKTVEKSLAHLKFEKYFKEMVCGGEGTGQASSALI